MLAIRVDVPRWLWLMAAWPSLATCIAAAVWCTGQGRLQRCPALAFVGVSVETPAIGVSLSRFGAAVSIFGGHAPSRQAPEDREKKASFRSEERRVGKGS